MASMLHCMENTAAIVTGALKPFGFAAVRAPLTVIGFVAAAAVVFYLAIGVLRGMLKYFIPRFLLPLGVNFRKIEGWTVITGATDGIGKEFALQLAAMGKDIVLVARNPQKLDAVVHEIKKQSPNVKTTVIVADFKEAGSLEFFERIRRELGSLDIGILINNVGIMVDAFLRYHENPLHLDIDQVNVNINSYVFMTRMILPGMLKRGKNKPSVLIDMASTLGIFDPPVQYLNLYPSTKAFNRYVTGALALEYANSGVIIQCVTPVIVRTNMAFTFAKNWLRWPAYVMGTGAQTYVRWTLTNIGIARETCGHWWHALQYHIFSWLPEWVPSSIISRVSMAAAKYGGSDSSSETKKAE